MDVGPGPVVNPALPNAEPSPAARARSLIDLIDRVTPTVRDPSSTTRMDTGEPTGDERLCQGDTTTAITGRQP